MSWKISGRIPFIRISNNLLNHIQPQALKRPDIRSILSFYIFILNTFIPFPLGTPHSSQANWCNTNKEKSYNGPTSGLFRRPSANSTLVQHNNIYHLAFQATFKLYFIYLLFYFLPILSHSCATAQLAQRNRSFHTPYIIFSLNTKTSGDGSKVICKLCRCFYQPLCL